MIPIIENAAFEHELSDSLAKAMDAYPKVITLLPMTHLVHRFVMSSGVYNPTLILSRAVHPQAQAVLVHRHGIYVWGETWEKV